MAESINVRSIIGVVVLIIIALSLLPIVLDTVATAAASLTGTSLTILNLIPLFYVVGIVLATVAWAVGKK